MIIKTGLMGINNELIIYDDDILSMKESICNLYNIIKNKVTGFDNIILDSYSSSTIEGANTSLDNVVKAYKKGYSNIKGDIMSLNCINAVKRLERESIISEAQIYSIWKIVVNKVCENESIRGDFYRSGMVYVGKHIPPSADKISYMMKSLVHFINSRDVDALVRASVGHFYFVYVHPFCDGNGRTSRLLFSKILYEEGYNKIFRIPVSNVIMNNLSGYYRAISNSEKLVNGVLDVTPFISYMFQALIICMTSLKEGFLSDIEKKVYALMSKHIGAEITVKKCSGILKVSESVARDALNKLTERGMLFKYKFGNKNIYRVSNLKG